MAKKHFYYCDRCKKKLIERLSDGSWKFLFGKSSDNGEAVVQMEIYGSIKMKCLRRGCNHINLLTFLPPGVKVFSNVRNVTQSDGI